MRAKDIKVGEHYRLKHYDEHDLKLLVDEIKKTERRRTWAGAYGGGTRVFGRIVDPRTGKTSLGAGLGYPLSKILGPWDEERYLETRRAQETQRAADAEAERLAKLIIEALARGGIRAEFQLSRGVIIPRSYMRALIELIRR